jgi:hypothetical protein
MLAQAQRAAASAGSRTCASSRERGAAAVPGRELRVVTSRLAAHHVADPQAMVREARACSRRAGVFLLSDAVAPEDPARDSFLNAFELLRDPSHVRDHRVSEWQAMFRARARATASAASTSTRSSTPGWRAWRRRRCRDRAARAVRRGARRGARPLRDPRQGDYAFRLDSAVLRGVRA